jgi:hypothetical protein
VSLTSMKMLPRPKRPMLVAFSSILHRIRDTRLQQAQERRVAAHDDPLAGT